MPQSEKYFLGPKLLSDTRDTIARVKGMPEPTTRLTPISTVHQETPQGFKLSRGTTTATSWGIGQTAAVTYQGSTNTVAVTNYSFQTGDWNIATAHLNVIFGNVGGTQTAIDIGPREYGRIATFGGTWTKGSTASVTLVQANSGGSGGTFAASNHIATVETAAATSLGTAVLLRVGTSWTLVSFECP